MTRCTEPSDEICSLPFSVTSTPFPTPCSGPLSIRDCLKIDSTQESALTQTEEAQKAHGLLVMKGIISLTEKGKCHAVQNDYDIVIPLFRRKLVRFQEDEPIIKQHFNFSWQPIEATPFGEIFSQHYFGSPAFEAVVDQSGFYDQDQEGGLHFHLLGRGVETYSLYEKEMWRDK